MFSKEKLRIIIVVLACSGAAWAAGVGPDAFGYYASNDVSFSFRNISASGTRVLANSDDDTATISIGFPFIFYGGQHTSLCVSSNGLITFGGCNPDFANADLAAVKLSGNRPLIAVFWDDLTFAARGADAVYYQTLGVFPRRQLVVQWNNVFGINTTGGMTFQAVLSEGENTILLQYLDVDANAPKVNGGAGATVGIRDAGGQTTGRVLQWSVNVPVLRNSMAISITPFLEVTIDIKPGSVPNSINLGSGGNVPVAIFSRPTFDARTVDPMTLSMASAAVMMRARGTPKAAPEDVNRDGLLDLVVHVATEALQLTKTDTEVVVTGRTLDGRFIRGRDTVRVVQ